jgi:hypothetical protein
MDKSFGCVLAILTICGVNSSLTKANYYLPQRPVLSLRIQRHGHGNATAKRGENERVRIRPRVPTTRLQRFVGNQFVIVAIANFVLQV